MFNGYATLISVLSDVGYGYVFGKRHYIAMGVNSKSAFQCSDRFQNCAKPNNEEIVASGDI